jgi:flagellar protein FliS
MTEEKIKEYSLRISQCSRSGLVVITDEIIIDYITSAKEAFGKGDIKEFRFCIKKAEQFVNELSSALDMRYEISGQLIQIYSYIRSCLIRADIRQSDEELDAAAGLVEKLMDAFKEVAKSDHSGSVMETTQKVYAGLTYGPGSKLNEVIL